MKHYAFFIGGYAGVGKDEAANFLIKNHNSPKIGIIDPCKRHVMDIYGFTKDQCFGPSQFRNAGDVRYPKKNISELTPLTLHKEDSEQEKKYLLYSEKNLEDKYETIIQGGKRGYLIPEGHPDFWLSPREALQKLGSLYNQMYEDTLIEKCISTHKSTAVPLFNGGFMCYKYLPWRGIVDESQARKNQISCTADLRLYSQVKAAQRSNSDEFRAILIRIKRPSVPNPPFDHPSETEQAKIPDSEFDYIVNNDGDIVDLHKKIHDIVFSVTGK